MKTPMEIAMEAIEWKETGAQPVAEMAHLPYATHEGLLKLPGADLRCYQLSDGRRIVDGEDVNKFFGFLPER